MKKMIAIIVGIASMWGNAVFGQEGSVSIQLVSMKDAGKSSCKLYWNIVNRTGLNITTFTYRPALKEADGSTLDSMIFQTKRLKNGEEVDHDSLAMDVPCQKIKTIKFSSVNLLFVDGTSRRDLMDKVGDSVKFSSKVSGVKVVP